MEINTCRAFLSLLNLYSASGFQSTFVIPNELIEAERHSVQFAQRLADFPIKTWL